MIFTYVTCATSKEAEKLGKLIIEQKLGACIDYWPVNSMYNWEGKFKRVSQIMMIVTTFQTKLESLNELISKHHSYSTPLIAGVDVTRINRAYKEWVMNEVEI